MSSTDKNRYAWCLSGNALYIQYHETEWGVSVHDDLKQFEKSLNRMNQFYSII